MEKSLHLSLAREVLQKDIRTEEEFRAVGAAVVRTLFAKGHELMKAVGLTLEAFGRVRAALAALKKDRASSSSKATASKAIQAFSGEIEAELARLVPKDFLERYSLERLGHLPRYLKALEIRLERAKQGLEKDRQKAAQAHVFAKALDKLASLKENAPDKISPAKRTAVEEFRWLVEEFKVSLFAPELRTAVPVSAKRLEAKFREIAGL